MKFEIFEIFEKFIFRFQFRNIFLIKIELLETSIFFVMSDIEFSALFRHCKIWSRSFKDKVSIHKDMLTISAISSHFIIFKNLKPFFGTEHSKSARLSRLDFN